jgi:DnaK suppressor protein
VDHAVDRFGRNMARNRGRSHDVTSTVHVPIELLRDTLEEQFQRYSDQLADLTVRSQEPDRGGSNDVTIAALITSTRRSVADTAHALRRMAEGSYGICERCAASIPPERLEILPHARYCVPCQRSETG